MRTKNLIHPGEILDAEFLKPLGISQNQLALDLHVPAPRINAIVRGKRSITADTALRLGASVFRPLCEIAERCICQWRESGAYQYLILK